jgi:hypothetical protein
MEVVAIVLAIALGAIALAVLARVLATRFTARAQDMVVAHPYASLAIGLLCALFMLALATVFGGAAHLVWVLVLVLALAAVMLWFGTGVVSGAVGLKLLRLMGREADDPVRTTAAGAGLMCLSVGVPFLGWAVVAALMIAGVGAIFGALVARTPKEPPAEADES